MLWKNLSFTKGILRCVIINFQMQVCRKEGSMDSKHITDSMFTLNWKRVIKTKKTLTGTHYTVRLKMNVQFQKLRRNSFLTLHGHNVHHQQRQLSKFLMHYQRSLLMLTARPRGQFPRWRRSRKRLSVRSVLRCPDL